MRVPRCWKRRCPAPADEDVIAFACALARQCFINEYAFDCTEAELAQVESLRDAGWR